MFDRGTNLTTNDAKRYRLFRDYLLNNAFVIFQKIKEGEEPFVSDIDFYGVIFDNPVNALEKLAGSPEAT
jgi:hypothetical protein